MHKYVCVYFLCTYIVHCLATYEFGEKKIQPCNDKKIPKFIAPLNTVPEQECQENCDEDSKQHLDAQ